MACGILDVSCNLYEFAKWVYSFFAPYLDPILNLISPLLNLIFSIWGLIISLFTALFNLGITITTYIFGFYYTIFTIDPTITIMVVLLQSYITIVVFGRVWNIIADLEIAGFKLPKIPL